MKAAQVQTDDLMAFVYYGKVKSVKNNGNDLLIYDVDNNDDFNVHGYQLVNRAFSADRYEKEEKVSKTEIAQILIQSFNRPFTVCFEKSNGEERQLRGRLVEPEPLLGRSYVEDLDIKEKHKLRQVDHRTILWLIVNDVKYVVKK